MVGGQTLEGILDTGSFDLLVFSSACDGCGDVERLYNHDSSSTYESGMLNARHSFGSGETWSHEAADEVSIGAYVAEKQWFWEVLHTEMPALQESSFQAIVGMGLPGSALLLAERRHKQLNQERLEIVGSGQVVPEELDRRVLESNRSVERARGKADLIVSLGIHAFSVCIGQEPGSPGYWTWNDAGPRTTPEVFSRIHAAGSLHWSVVMTSARIGPDASGEVFDLGCTGEAGSCGALLDTGTSLLAAPRDAIEQVRQALNKLDGDCEKIHMLPSFRFQLGGIELELPPSSYVGRITGTIPEGFLDILHFDKIGVSYDVDDEESSCQPLFMSIDAETALGPMWILGLPFFRKYYTVFDSQPPQAPQAERVNSVFIAEADSQCMPSANMFSLHEVLPSDKPVTVHASKLRVPSWIRNMAAGAFVDL